MYSRCDKQVLRNGSHFADACDADAADIIVTALNDRAVWTPIDNDQTQGGDIIEIETHTGPKRILGIVHNVRQESDEYACSCGTRWDVAEGDKHPCPSLLIT